MCVYVDVYIPAGSVVVAVAGLVVVVAAGQSTPVSQGTLSSSPSCASQAEPMYLYKGVGLVDFD